MQLGTVAAGIRIHRQMEMPVGGHPMMIATGTELCKSRTEFCKGREERGRSHRPVAPGGYRSAPLRTLSMPRDGQIAGTEGSRGRRRKRKREREKVRKRERERK